MSPEKQAVIERARAEHGDIRPCDGKTWEECFTEEEGYGKFLWFNDQIGNTRIVEIKKCRKCGKLKNINEFSKCSKSADKHQGYCKECMIIYNFEWEKNHLKERKAYKKEHLKNYLEHSMKYKKKYPERCKAMGIVKCTIKAGKLIRKSCEICGAPKAEAHHDDYSKPLSVRWLCRKHHRELHKNIKNGTIKMQIIGRIV